MSTIAIVGSSPRLGAAIAERFGREGYSVALIASRRDELARVVDSTAVRGIQARTYHADVCDQQALAVAMVKAAEELGAVEVLQYNQFGSLRLRHGASDSGVGGMPRGAGFPSLGAATAIQQVLPAMRQAARGTILLLDGADDGEGVEDPKGADSTAAFTRKSYVESLHDALSRHNIHVGHIVVGGRIGTGDPMLGPEALAERLWTIHRWRGPLRTTVAPRDEALRFRPTRAMTERSSRCRLCS